MTTNMNKTKTIIGAVAAGAVIAGSVFLPFGKAGFTDYKFWYIQRNDAGQIMEAAVRFYEGDYVEKNGKQVYVREKRLEDKDLKHLGNEKFMVEKSGDEAVIYTPVDFGVIYTDDELRAFLDREISKDKSREVIPEQKYEKTAL